MLEGYGTTYPYEQDYLEEMSVATMFSLDDLVRVYRQFKNKAETTKFLALCIKLHIYSPWYAYGLYQAGLLTETTIDL